MTYGLMVLTDGRGNCLERTVQSLRAAWPDDVYIAKKVMVCDSLNKDYRDWVKAEFPDFKVLTSSRKLGFHGAIQLGWENLKDAVQWIFHLEDDFDLSPCGSLPIGGMTEVMRNSEIAQVALKRQPWAEVEKQAGGIVEMWPESYVDQKIAGHDVAVHQNFFTTNPSLYHHSIAWRGWPQVNGSEAEFTKRLLSEGKSFAYWGKKFDAPRVHHIGDERVGTGY